MDPFLLALESATNAHDLDLLVRCFAPGYRNETPAHPSRDFRGPDQVRDNWRQIFTFVPDVRARVLGWTTAVPAVGSDVDSEVWSEWEMSGTRRDGSRHLMRGVIIFGVRDGQAAFARFYLEPADEGSSAPVGAAVRHQVHADRPS
jgi:hypothetical protein